MGTYGVAKLVMLFAKSAAFASKNCFCKEKFLLSLFLLQCTARVDYANRLKKKHLFATTTAIYLRYHHSAIAVDKAMRKAQINTCTK